MQLTIPCCPSRSSIPWPRLSIPMRTRTQLRRIRVSVCDLANQAHIPPCLQPPPRPLSQLAPLMLPRMATVNARGSVLSVCCHGWGAGPGWCCWDTYCLCPCSCCPPFGMQWPFLPILTRILILGIRCNRVVPSDVVLLILGIRFACAVPRGSDIRNYPGGDALAQLHTHVELTKSPNAGS